MVRLTLDRPEDSEYEVAFMQRGIGTLDVFPSIWGRKCFVLHQLDMSNVAVQTGRVDRARARTMSNGWMSGWRSSLTRTDRCVVSGLDTQVDLSARPDDWLRGSSN